MIFTRVYKSLSECRFELNEFDIKRACIEEVVKSFPKTTKTNGIWEIDNWDDENTGRLIIELKYIVTEDVANDSEYDKSTDSAVQSNSSTDDCAA